MFKFNRVVISEANVNRLLVDKKITNEEHAAFFMNFCYKECVSEDIRREIGLDNIQMNGTPVKINSNSDIATLKKQAQTLYRFAKNASTILKSITERTNALKAHYNDDGKYISDLNALTFEELRAICENTVAETISKPIPIPNYTSQEKMAAEANDALELAWITISRAAVSYRASFIMCGAQI